MSGRVVGKRSVNGLTVVRLAGEFDVAAIQGLRRGLHPSHFATIPDLALDLREVTFLDCAAVGVLIAARNRVSLEGGCLRVTGLQTEPRRLLGLCRLDGVFCLHESLVQATAVVCALHASPQSLQRPAPPTTTHLTRH